MPVTRRTSKLLAVLDGQAADPPPLWLMRQAGRYLPEYRAIRAKAANFLHFCYSPDAAAEATLQPIQRFDFDAAILFSDILVVPDALGVKVEFREGEGPVLEPVGAGDLGRLNVSRVRAHLAPVYEAVAKVRASLAPEKALIGFAGAPWTVACYMAEGHGSRDFPAPKAWMWRDRSSFARLIDILVAATVEHLSAQIEAGADCVQLFDSWSGVLPENEFRDYSIAPARAVADALKKRHPAARIIGFPRGAGTMLGEYAAKAGVDAVGLDYTVPLAAAQALPKSVVLQGNLDPILLLAGGAALGERIRGIRAAFAGRPHIFNLGHGILPETPIAHVEAMIAAVRAEA